jgi:predicted transcriptional regulator
MLNNNQQIPTNGQRFLDAYNAIDRALRVQYNFKTTISFTDLVRRCADLNHIIRQHEDDLINFARLRNAIIHNSDSSRVVAEPHDSVVGTLEKIARLITTPPLVVDITKSRGNVVIVDASRTVREFIMERGGSGHGTIPVYKGTNLIGVIRWREFVANLGHVLTEGKSIDAFINSTDVEDLIRAFPESGLYTVASRNVTIEEVMTMFDKSSRLACVIITNSGGATELPVGIVTNADIMYLIDIIEKY